MAKELDWDERGEICRSSLAFLHFLQGSWEGQGETHGQAVQARFEARLRFGDTFLQCEEVMRGEDGEIAHQDLAMMRYDPDAEVVRVTHYMAHGWVSEQLVRPFDGGPGAFWYAGPFSPRVELRPEGDDVLIVRVVLPEQEQPDTEVRYRRA